MVGPSETIYEQVFATKRKGGVTARKAERHVVINELENVSEGV